MMIHMSSWDQSFVESADDVATRLSRARSWTPSDCDPALTTMVMSNQSAFVESTSRLVPGNRHRGSNRRRTLNGDAPSSLSTGDNLISARCKSVSGTNLCWTPTSQPDDGHSDDLRTTEDFNRLSLLTCDGERLYENIALPAITAPSNFQPDVTSSSTASQPSTSRLLFPGDGVARKASSSSSTSSVFDSVLELCTSSSRCSSCSETATSVAATPVGDSSPQPDSGNGSTTDTAVEHIRCSRLLSSDVGGNPSYSLVASFLPEWDAERLETVYGRLAQSDFYHGRLTIVAAAERLRQTPVGTFLLRDSTDDRYLFSISVQTCRGTTSIRMIYHAGLFHLDCSPEQEHLTPTFDCALRLVAHYVRICSDRRRTGNSYVFLENSGRRDTPVVLWRPLYRQVSRLTHLCRRAVNSALSQGPSGTQADRESVVDRLQLMPSLKSYLKDYPYEL